MYMSLSHGDASSHLNLNSTDKRKDSPKRLHRCGHRDGPLPTVGRKQRQEPDCCGLGQSFGIRWAVHRWESQSDREDECILIPIPKLASCEWWPRLASPTRQDIKPTPRTRTRSAKAIPARQEVWFCRKLTTIDDTTSLCWLLSM